MEVKIKLPPFNGSNGNVCCLQIWALSVLPANHPLHKYLENHYNDMESFRPNWSTWHPAMHPLLSQACGVFHLKYISTELSEYWKEQSRSDAAITLLPAKAISTAIRKERNWESQLSTFFIQRYKLYKFCGMQNPDAALPTPVPNGPGSGAPSISPPPGLAPGNAGLQVVNPNFNAGLFQTYKDSTFRSQTIRVKIRNGELPALPLSKVDQQSMCLAYHTKGVCNSNCAHSTDHVLYTKDEYTPSCTWCTACYLSASKGGRFRNKLNAIQFLNPHDSAVVNVPKPLPLFPTIPSTLPVILPALIPTVLSIVPAAATSKCSAPHLTTSTGKKVKTNSIPPELGKCIVMRM